jgi:membrane protein DedA with SNARE-associated domain
MMGSALTEFFHSLSGGWGYLFLFCSSLGENLFPPMPGDTFVVLGAFLVGRGQMEFLPAYLATTAGSLCGFMILFFAGRTWGFRLFQSPGGRFFSRERLEQVTRWFDRHGYRVIALNRFLSGFRSVVSFAAGTVKMDSRRVALLGLVSCVLWNALLMGVGILIGENWAVIVRHYQRFVFLLICLLILFWWVKARWTRWKKVGTKQE